jgi:hypothetical protein
MRRISVGWNFRACRIAVLFVVLGSLAAAGAEASETPASAEQIAIWIRQLDDNAYSVRESASKNLLKSGKAVIGPVAKAAVGNSVEVTSRTIHVLEELASSDDVATVEEAIEALLTLARSDQPAAPRARKALRNYQYRIVGMLERCGAQIDFREDLVVGVDFNGAKVLKGYLHLLHELPDLEHLSFSTPLMDDERLAELQGLPRLWDLYLYRSNVSDAGLKYLKTFPSLRRVPMGETRVTDKGLVHLKDLTQLEYVGLRGNRVTDDGLVHLKNLTKLTGLFLAETQVTNAGMEHLKGMTALQQVYLWDTKVTEAGVAKLKKALPQAQVILKQEQ